MQHLAVRGALCGPAIESATWLRTRPFLVDVKGDETDENLSHAQAIHRLAVRACYAAPSGSATGAKRPAASWPNRPMREALGVYLDSDEIAPLH
jgi:hypothetical protein